MATKQTISKSPTQLASAAGVKRGVGAPSMYSRTLAHEICSRIAAGETLTDICKAEHMPDRNTVAAWVYDDRDGFNSVYVRAREAAMDLMAEDLLSIADEKHTVIEVEETDPEGRPLLDADGNVKLRSVRVPLSSDVIARNRLRVDTRKWYLAKLAPRRFGDKVVTEHTGPGGGPVQIAALDLKNLSDVELAQMQELLSRAGTTGGAV
jgi:hypothetical protein